MKINRSPYQQSPSSLSKQLPYWEESIPLPEFPPSPGLVVTPSQIILPRVKEKRKVVAKLPIVTPHPKHTFSLRLSYPLIFFLAAVFILPSFFFGSFLLARSLIGKVGKGGEGVAPPPTVVVPTSPLPSPFQEVSIVLPWRISSAVIPVPPSDTPADLTKNWDSYVNPTFRFSFKYPKEWFLTEFANSTSSILKLSYPVRSGQVGSFAAGEKAYILVLQEEKKGKTLEDILSTRYNFSNIEKEKVEISGKNGWRIYNATGKGEVTVLIEHGQKTIFIEGGVKDIKELTVYRSLFILIQNTFSFS